MGRGKPDLFYQVHRSVDEAHEIITATAVTPGDVSEGHMLEELFKDTAGYRQDSLHGGRGQQIRDHRELSGLFLTWVYESTCPI